MKLVYLAGQWNEYEDNWKEKVKKVTTFNYFDPEFDSNQSSPETFFPEDMEAVKKADILIANPGKVSSESTWIEIGYFLGLKTKRPGEKCNKLIIIWQKDRNPKWSIEFAKKAGIVVGSVKQAIVELKKLDNPS